MNDKLDVGHDALTPPTTDDVVPQAATADAPQGPHETVEMESMVELARRGQIDDLPAAIRDALGIEPEMPLPDDLDDEQYRLVLVYLRARIEIRNRPPKPEPVPESVLEAVAPPAWPSPADLIAMARGNLPVDLKMQPDALYIIAQLQRMERVEALFYGRASAFVRNVNASGPIPMSFLAEVYSSAAELAAEFGVSVDEVLGWGEFLPADRAWQAECLTHGYVRAPR